jgi:flagellar motor switch protein FliM
VRRNATSENLNVLKEKLASVDVNVIAEIGKITLKVGDVLSLQRGDVIPLYNTRVGDPFSLNIGNKMKFLCRPGVIGKKIVVQITKKIAGLEQDEFEDLTEGEELS